LHCDPGYTMPHAAVQLIPAGTRNHDFAVPVGVAVGDVVCVCVEEPVNVGEFEGVPVSELDGVGVRDVDEV